MSNQKAHLETQFENGNKWKILKKEKLTRKGLKGQIIFVIVLNLRWSKIKIQNPTVYQLHLRINPTKKGESLVVHK